MESQIVSKRDSKHIEFCDSWDSLKSWYILGWTRTAVIGVENDFSWLGSIQWQIVVRSPLIDMSKFEFAAICIARRNYQTSIVGELWHLDYAAVGRLHWLHMPLVFFRNPGNLFSISWILPPYSY